MTGFPDHHRDMAADVLTLRALNRATLGRQHLLARTAMPPGALVDHLVGMQAQVPGDPYVAVWSRLSPFDPEDLSRALADRRLVRTWVMRGTIHLVGADDCLTLRPLMQPVIDGGLARHRDHAPALAGVDLDPVLAFARAAMDGAALSGNELRAALAERFPQLEPAALAFACSCQLALVQAPPRGLWGSSSQVRLTTAESWLGRPLAASPSIDDVVRRYLAAFGPATVADVSTWSRLAGMREVVERLRPQLRVFHGEDGRELFDVPEAPAIEVDAPAPVRFLPEYDNVLLSHADRSRFGDKADAGLLYPDQNPGRGHVLIDGRLRATWKWTQDRKAGTAAIAVLHVAMAKRAVASIEAEARRLLRFLAAGHEHEVVTRAVG